MPEEDAWAGFFNPRCILERLDLPGASGDVVEFGCGYGTFTVPAAQLSTSTVYAIDIEAPLVAETVRKAREAGLTNVVGEVRDLLAAGCGRPDASAGYAMLFNLLHVENPVGLLREARRVLRPDGRVAAIHWRDDVPTPRGPSLPIRPTAEQCRYWGEEAGLEFVRYESLCCCSWHWGLALRRP
jgi:SAM-dependent methyltransferase